MNRSFNQSFLMYYYYILKNNIDINSINLEKYKYFIENEFENKFFYQDLKRKLYQYSSSKEKVKEFDERYTIEEINNIYKKWEADNPHLLKEIEKNYKPLFYKNLSLEEFKDFYHEDDYTDRKCDYCSLSEIEISQLIRDDKIFSKRLFQRGRSMEVDRKDSLQEYSINNIVLCCYWCNNAKTDEFSYDEFKFIGKSFKEIWRCRLENNFDYY